MNASTTTRELAPQPTLTVEPFFLLWAPLKAESSLSLSKWVETIVLNLSPEPENICHFVVGSLQGDPQ